MTMNVPWSDDQADNEEAHRLQYIDCKCEDHNLCTPDEGCYERAAAWARRFEGVARNG